MRWFVAVTVALAILGALWQADLGATGGLFQSPQTPTAEMPSPTATIQPASATPSEAGLPTETSAPEATETSVPPQGEPTQPPTASPDPTETPTPGPVPLRTEEEHGLPTGELAPTEAEAGAERYADSESTLGFDWGTLLDSLALLLSYAWLFCGIALFAVLSALFLALWLRSRSDRADGTDEVEDAGNEVAEEGSGE